MSQHIIGGGIANGKTFATEEEWNLKWQEIARQEQLKAQQQANNAFIPVQQEQEKRWSKRMD